MISILSKLKNYILLGSFAFCSFACSEDNFDKLANKMANKFSAPVIDIKQFKIEAAKGKLIVLDARELPEYTVSHIPNAKHIGYKTFDISWVNKNISKKDKVIVYCSVGYRSGEIAEKLKNNGYDVYNLKGGIFNWVNKGYQVVDTKGKITALIHGYDQTWSKWLKKGSIKFDAQ